MPKGRPEERTHLLIYGPSKSLVENGLLKRFMLHKCETIADFERTPDRIAARIRGIALTGLMPTRGAILAKYPNVEIISSYGVGYDHVDTAYAVSNGIVVTNTADVLTEEVADMAFGLLVATAREFVMADRYVRSGEWLSKPYPLTVGSLRDRKVGMVGMGRIGRAIARRLDAALIPVVYHSRNVVGDVSHRHFPELIRMAGAVDTLIVIAPGNASTANLVDAQVMKALGPRGIIINVARGSVVDQPALIHALQAGTILAAGLDVFAEEPAVPDELIAMPNVVLLPHIGSASVVTRDAMHQLVVDNLKLWFDGKAPMTPIAETPVIGR